MSEEGTPETTATAETPAVTVEATTPVSFIDKEGNFTEGWENAYLTEDQRGNARVAGGRVKSVQGLLATVINSDKMISGDKILRPSDNFGDADWDEFHRAGGWTGNPIEITAPEGLPKGLWSDDRATKFSEGFDRLRLNPKQVEGLIEMHNADILEQITNRDNDIATAREELKTALLTEKGNAYTQFEHNGNFAITKGSQGDQELQARVSQKFGNDPDFVRIMGNLGGDFAESGSIPTIKTAPTPGDIQTQINDIMKSDAFMKATHPEHASTMKKLRQLHIDKTKVRQSA